MAACPASPGCHMSLYEVLGRRVPHRIQIFQTLGYLRFKGTMLLNLNDYKKVDEIV